MSCVDAHSWMRIGAGCPLTPEARDRWRSYISRALGAASGALHCCLEHADQIRIVSLRLLRAASNAGAPPVPRRLDAGRDPRHRGDHRAGRRAGYRQGGAGVLCAGAKPGHSGQAAAGGSDLPDDDPVAAGAGRPAGGAGRDPGGDGGDLRLLEGPVLSAGGPRVRGLAGQRHRRQAPAGPAQDRPAGRGVAVQGRRAAAAAPQLRATTPDSPAAGCGPLPSRSGGGADCREAAGRKAAGGRPDQAVGGGLRHLRRLGPGHVGRAHRRDTRSQGAGAAGPGPYARQAWRAGGGLLWPLHRPSRVPAGQDAGPGDLLDTDIAELDGKLEELIAPFAHAVERLDEITGVGRTAARVIISEIGVDMGRFATAGHLASWAKFTPGVKESAGKKKGKASTGHGNPYLARVLGEAAVAAGKTDTFLGERYRRIARRRGAKKAIVAVGRSILVIVWHLLSDPDARFHDLGPGFYDTHSNADRAKRNHVRQLQALGYKVTLEPAA